MPRLVTRRPHRGMVANRFSFTVSVDRLDFGSADRVRQRAELSVQWTRGNKSATTSGRTPKDTAATFDLETMTLVCTLFSRPEQPTSFERKSCTFEAVEKIGGRCVLATARVQHASLRSENATVSVWLCAVSVWLCACVRL